MSRKTQVIDLASGELIDLVGETLQNRFLIG